MSSDHRGLRQVGETKEDTRYRFAIDIVMGALLNDVSAELQSAKYEEIIRKTAQLTGILFSIDNVIEHYMSLHLPNE